MNEQSNKTLRLGCHDVFNAFMVKKAQFCGEFDIPYCPTTANNIPKELVAYDKPFRNGDENSFVHFYIDDYKFDGPNGIWNKPQKALTKLMKYQGIITPDFSMYQDMPMAMKIFATYKMRAFGYWLTQNGLTVINNVRWGTRDTYRYCFEGIPKQSIVAVGTAGCIKEKCNWYRYKSGLDKMVEVLEPKTILVYGSAPDRFFKEIRDSGIEVISFPSQTCLAFRMRAA